MTVGTTIYTAVVGCGVATQLFHVPLLLAQKQLFTLKTIVEKAGPKSIDTINKTYRTNIRWTNDIQNVINDEDIELVVIATPNHMHFGMAKACLEAGKHVLVDKPVTPTYAEAAELALIAQRCNRRLMTFQNRRLDGDFLTVKKLIEERAIGEAYEVESHYDRLRMQLNGTWKEGTQPGCGNTWNLAPHLIDQCMVLFGRPDSVMGLVQNVRQLGHSNLDDSFTIHLYYTTTARPVTCILRGTLSAVTAKPLRFIVRGDRGTYTKRGHDVQEGQMKKHMSPWEPDFGIEPKSQWGEIEVQNNDGLFEFDFLPTLKGEYNRIYPNIAGVIEGKEEPLVRWEESAAVVQILQLAFQSAQEGRTLPMPHA
ncbi:putative oxidoreductase C26H5,09c OS=Schizosaccharomyces pombe (strain 972 / ATCC 24843) GN=SPAC26H5.09c PE=2 SV=3 [Rhizoctonia solani AG-1 IB]|uniref:Putative oxidoreductase C26H5,09c n=1 Tax=Thanatephorus cucumeris (strain AG1-IB / isolate 7/3/14) TaxID=1108050 RepID=A0A0B7FGR8_THACB|nr:putative oxidoreductase C26H5,09c OS=Schizosaccharomyces pombe (strain 972 / ATCC 24843) GN=SPAC26H5.09c PE=2 SV=3 [Rhizoctonia solani AG-1 IB]